MTRHQRSSRRTILCLEPLEDRCLLSTGYTLVDLGGLPGLSYKQSSALCINEAGDIVGDSFTSAPGPSGTSRHPVVWHRDASGTYRITDLGLLVPPGTSASLQTLNINDRGEVLGLTATDIGSYTFLVRPEDTDGDGRPDRWYRDTDNGGDGFNDLMINLTAVSGGAAVSSSAINNRGQMIGQYMLNQFDGSGNLVTNSSVGGQDINNNGQIVGDYYHDDGPGTPQIVVKNSLWQVDAGGNVISGPTALGMSRASDINPSGSAIVGDRQVWQAGTVSDLGTLGGPNTYASAVNDATAAHPVQVVGRSELKNRSSEAFVWQGGTMTSLNKYLPRNSTYKLDQNASGINNAGWIIGSVRVALNRTFEFHGFVMIPTSNLMAAAQQTGGATDVSFARHQVQPILAEALVRWQAAGMDTSALHGIDVRIAELPGGTLGQASGHTIWVDQNAAGWRWFVDATPGDDSEFTTPGNQGEQNRMDLLTILEHEVGHLLGYDHQATGVMEDTLAAGLRRRTGSTEVKDWPVILGVLVSEPLSKRRW